MSAFFVAQSISRYLSSTSLKIDARPMSREATPTHPFSRLTLQVALSAMDWHHQTFISSMVSTARLAPTDARQRWIDNGGIARVLMVKGQHASTSSIRPGVQRFILSVHQLDYAYVNGLWLWWFTPRFEIMSDCYCNINRLHRPEVQLTAYL